ncbi:MAG: Undecaprenyl phosphate-alpha-4-amino-4-deoxy-L-arabinose arabinosyl transferase [Rhodocyclaceae bacterium]|nr:Undecaprenyl phosphate-alpha-4-amino-4-deoxy-L-arabinose arabinosyl transferase [Rhodocyclaceae bacterium]
MSARGGLWHWLVLVLPLASFLPWLGTPPLFDVDEGAFAEATREMFERGDFLFTYLNGSPRFDKPILSYWLQALFVALLGPNEWAFRMPSALAACAWSWAVWQFAKTYFSEDTANLALAITATAIGPFLIGRAATADALLNLWLALACFDAWRHVNGGGKAPLRRCYLWVGLGLLTKGPVAALIPIAVTLMYALSTRTSASIKIWLAAIRDPVGWLILLAVAAPWYGFAWQRHGMDFIRGFLLHHNLSRFSGPLEGHGGGLFYYLIVIPLLLMPWSGLLVPMLARLRHDLRDALTRFLWLWVGFVFVFFTLSGTKLPHYALYGTTPLFLLLARRTNAHHGLWSLVTLALPALWLLVLALLPSIITVLTAQVSGYYQAQFARAAHQLAPGYYPMTLGALAVYFVIANRKAWPIGRRLAGGAALSSLTLAAVVAPWIGDVLQGPVKTAGLRARLQPAVLWNFGAPSFSVYRQAVTPVRPPQPGELALTRSDRLDAEALRQVEIVYQAGGVVLVRRR